MFIRLLPILGLIVSCAPHALADISFLGVPNARWGFTGASIGVEGLSVEDFEDVNLEPGLQVRWTAPLGNFGPTSVLPNTFDPFTDDEHGTAFRGAAWTGTRCLINTRTNRPFPYSQAGSWGNLELLFDPPVRTVAFSLHQMEINNRIRINGIDRGTTMALTGLPINGARMGYVIINATGTDTISSMMIESLNGDGFALDYVAFTAEPLPPISVTVFPAKQWGAPDADLGFENAAIETFEDVNLIPGLQVACESPLGNLAPTSTLPNVFNPVTDDPFGNAFDMGVWDGTHALINTRDNQSHPYNELGSWGDTIFHFNPGAPRVGFAMGDLEFNAQLIINGRTTGLLPGVLFGARQGFIRVDSTAAIRSVRIFNARTSFNDGIVFDHVAFRSCRVDINHDGVVNSQDFFDFLAFFFSASPDADFNEDAVVNSQDFFDFLVAFFDGC